ncbi:MAG: hypothetical protein ABEJ79_01140 [Halolamina sp.]
MPDTQRPATERTTATPTATETQTAEATVDCDLCDQTVVADEAVPVTVGDAGDETLCSFCASSLFEDLDVAPSGVEPADSGTDAGSASDSHVTPIAGDSGRAAPATDDDRAAAVSWAPPALDPGTGLAGAVVKMHVLSLSLLWAIHRTNVRITERLIDEVDVQLLAVLGTVLMTAVLLVSALV